MKNYKSIKFKNATLTKTYDKDKVTVIDLIRKSGEYVGPMPLAVARPMESPSAREVAYPQAIEYDGNTQYVFLSDCGSAAATRRQVLYEFNKLTGEYAYKGFITVTFPTATNHTIRGVRMLDYQYTTGTVSASGLTVTGTGTAWKTAGFAAGGRISFGSTTRSQSARWYEIATVDTDTQITLVAPVDAPVNNVPFVFEELRGLIATTNATVTNGGLFLVKGLNFDTFANGGVTIPAATNIDNIRACYWLADAATVTTTLAWGVAVDEMSSFSNHDVYLLNSGFKIYKFNARQPLNSLSAGKSSEAFLFATGNATITGAASQTNNGRICTTQHGAGAGEKSIYFVTTTRINRCALSGITNGSTTFVNDSMVEVPNGGSATVQAGAALSSIEYSDSIDAFVVNISASTIGKSYITKYRTDGSPFDINYMSEARTFDQSSASGDSPVFPSITGMTFTSWVESGVMHTARMGTSILNNQVYAIPLGAECLMNQNQGLITPVFDLPNAHKFESVLVKAKTTHGKGALAVGGETYNLFYRTSGIADNSGSWTACDEGDLSGASGNQIQFKITFRIAGNTCIPAQIKELTVTYEDQNTDSHLQPSTKYSSLVNSQIAYRLDEAFDTSVPDLTIKLYNVQTNIVILSDTVAQSGFGTWQYSTNGTTWLPFNAAAANVAGSYIRYTANGLPAGVKIKAIVNRT
ncbi:hypothetical protein [Rufibacter ruber]|uniref:hypothetical protein n=1 Tax=Rufibacter ruber TaxID=1783499 RepID=UPI00083482C3|nr:hypothetical protein [Rufibacter ruber]